MMAFQDYDDIDQGLKDEVSRICDLNLPLNPKQIENWFNARVESGGELGVYKELAKWVSETRGYDMSRWARSVIERRLGFKRSV